MGSGGDALRCLNPKLPTLGGQLLAAGGKLLLLGSEGLRHGLNENDYVYTIDPKTGGLSLLRAEEENMYSSVGSDCRYGGGEPRQARGEELFHLTTRWGNSHLYRLSPDGSSHPVVTKDGSIDPSPLHLQPTPFCWWPCMMESSRSSIRLDLRTGKVKRLSHFNDAALKGSTSPPSAPSAWRARR